MRSIVAILMFIGLAAASPAASVEWSPQPWLEDLDQARQAFATKYANIDWAEHDRDLALSRLFERVEERLRSARSDQEAKSYFDRLIERIGDGHVSIEWPRSAETSVASSAPAKVPIGYDACRELGFDGGRSTPGIATLLPGYRAEGAPDPFPGGIVPSGSQTVGVLRISGFGPEGSPAICRSALQALRLPADKPCDDQCRDAVLDWSYTRITAALEEQVRALKAAGATALMVDITDNGGGSEWAEAAARIVSPVRLTSERRGFVRGAHWSEQWKTLAEALRKAAATAARSDGSRLLGWAAEAEQARQEAEQRCSGGANCSLVARAGYATGLVGSARADIFKGKPWADLVFSPAQFPYHDSVWTGPLVVLVDDQTWSAAEEFAAVLQDNSAAVVLGARTGGAGCGHTNGGTPTILKNSGATLELPDCVRFRADGSNEVAGVIPDVLTGMKARDSGAFRAKLIERHFAEAVRLASERRGS